jgi:hypothetical protein
MNDDVLARRLLGWQTTDDEDGVGDDPAIRTTTSVIQHALTLLSSEGVLDFSNHSNTTTTTNNNRRDPLSIVIGYHQLISKCLDNNGTQPALSSSSSSRDDSSNECIKLACEIVRQVNDKIISALRCDSNNNNNNGPRELAVRHLQMIISNVHPHVVTDIRLMGPIYRGFCSLAEILNSTLLLPGVEDDDGGTSSMTITTAPLLSSLDQEFEHVLERASTCLFQLGLLDEGLNWVEQMLLRIKDSSEKTTTSSSSITTTDDDDNVRYDYSRETKKEEKCYYIPTSKNNIIGIHVNCCL